MALLNVDFHSYYLGMDSPLTVLLPEKRGRKPEAAPDKKYPVLYLLHGQTTTLRGSERAIWSCWSGITMSSWLCLRHTEAFTQMENTGTCTLITSQRSFPSL